MNQWTVAVSISLLAAVAGAAVAGPVPRDARPIKGQPNVLPGMDNPFSENFDSYVAGSGIAGQGGWQLWAPGAPDAFVDNSVSSSSPNSLRLDGESDVIQLVNLNSGQWRFTADTWFPSTATADGYLIALNTWPYVGIQSWSLELSWGWASGMVSEYASPVNQTPAIRDQWVPVRVEVDLDADLLNVWYNNVQVVIDRPWSSNIGIGGAVSIQVWDFYSAGFGMGALFYDNIVFEAITAGCYANCDGSTTPPILNVDDFTCFINQFAAAQPLPHAQQLTHYANCDGSTVAPVLNVDDFTCFINAFAAGCP